MDKYGSNKHPQNKKAVPKFGTAFQVYQPDHYLEGPSTNVNSGFGPDLVHW